MISNIFAQFSTPPYHGHRDDRHLWDVEDDGEEEGWQDVDGQVDRGGVPTTVLNHPQEIKKSAKWSETAIKSI